MKQFTEAEFRAYVEQQYGGDPPNGSTRPVSVFEQVDRWLERGDGAAIYENHDLGHPGMGSCQITSFGGPMAQLETDDPPECLPDIGNQINWRYVLIGTCRRNCDGITGE
jgi:hypothetical protein